MSVKNTMLDRMQKAAGEREEDAPLEPRFSPKLASGEKLSKGSIVRCTRCGGQREYFGGCAGCVELDKKVCDCGGLVKDHVFSYGSSANKRIWGCWHCYPHCRAISCDPVKQEKTRIDGVHRWVDVL